MVVVKTSPEVADALRAGLAEIRRQFDVPTSFPPEVLAEADEAARRSFGAATGHVDRTSIEFVTLDPLGSTDLDQAFALEAAGSDIVLHYAIADVMSFVDPGGAIDAESWRRGVTLYLPDGRAGLHPPQLAEGAASLLPDGDRPAVVFTVRVPDNGAARLDGVERALVRSRAQLAYETVRDHELPSEFTELSRRIEAAERERGADRIDFPEQEVERTDHGFELQFRPRLPVEHDGAALSLATNLAVADLLVAARTGLFRTMPGLDAAGEHRLRHAARAFGLAWPPDVDVVTFEQSLPRDEPRSAAFQLALRRFSGSAGYEPFRDGEVPWHAAVAATYVHATAPLRRLADRYVIEAALAVFAGDEPPQIVVEAFEQLPATMRRTESHAGQIERAAIDLAEAVVLAGREGDVFTAIVTDEDERGVRFQLTDPAVIARTTARRVDPGDEIEVKLVRADPTSRQVEFERVG